MNYDNLLRKRTYHYVIAGGSVPQFKDVVPEWIDTINIFKNPEAITTVIWLAHHLLAVAFGVLLFTHYFHWTNLLWWAGFVLLHAHFFHTFWYHRYCSHRAFRFRGKWFCWLMYWLNPLLIKEEAYVIPHVVHHKRPDRIGDPYGPVNGFWGSLSATESANFFNRSMSEKQFNACLALLSHIPSAWNSLDRFRATGSFEKAWRYPMRFLLANGVWTSLFVMLGRPDLLCAWYLAVISFLIIMRDFNYRGHDAHVHHDAKLDQNSGALNQFFYGYLASEWHDNHHRFSSSAKNGFGTAQIDVSFAITVWLSRIGIIKHYVDSTPAYARQIAQRASQEQSKKNGWGREQQSPPARQQ